MNCTHFMTTIYIIRHHASKFMSNFFATAKFDWSQGKIWELVFAKAWSRSKSQQCIWLHIYIYFFQIIFDKNAKCLSPLEKNKNKWKTIDVNKLKQPKKVKTTKCGRLIATWLICDNTPKQTWRRQKTKHSLIAGNTNIILSTKNIVIVLTLCAGNKIFSTVPLSFFKVVWLL